MCVYVKDSSPVLAEASQSEVIKVRKNRMKVYEVRRQSEVVSSSLHKIVIFVTS